LRVKLLAKGFPPEEVEAALSSLAAAGYLDDERWAAQFIRRQLEEGRGWNWIRLKLSMARAPVPPPVTATAETRSALALLERRHVDPSALTDRRERAKITRFLRGRGYRLAAISASLGPGLEGDETED
jgi:regulatory protein